MPSGNQGQGQGQGRKNEGQGQDRANGGLREQAQNVGQNLQQGAEQVASRLREGLDTARDEAAHRLRKAEGTIARNPAPSVLIGFGVGFGIGLVLTALASRREETWADRYLPDSLHDLPDHLANSNAARHLRNAPDALHHTYSHLAETLRDLPSAIARHLPKH